MSWSTDPLTQYIDVTVLYPYLVAGDDIGNMSKKRLEGGGSGWQEVRE